MTITQIIHFRLASPSSASTHAQQALGALKGTKAPENYVLGTQVQDKNRLQLTSEWHDAQAEASAAANAYRETVLFSLGTPEKMLHVSFSSGAPVFGAKGPMQSPLVECVQIYFRAEDVAKAEFRNKIEADFQEFDRQCSAVIRGNGGLAYGWVIEEQEHESVVGGGKARCFFVARGWEGMQFFQELVQTEEFKGAIGILEGWGAKWDMWHVKREY